MDTSPTPPASQPDPAPRPRPVQRRRRVWPWIVGAVAVLLVAVLTVPLLFAPRSSAASGYLTATVETRDVARTAQGTGTVVDARIVSVAADGTWAVSSIAGVATDNVVQTAAVKVNKVRVKVGDSVEKGDKLAVVTDAADEKTTIKAPRSGVIRSVSAYKGATVSGTLVTLSTGGIRVSADISEYDVASVRAGQTAEVGVDGLAATAEGTVESIGSPTSDQTQTTTSTVTEFPVIATISKSPRGLRIGMTVQLTIDVQRADGVLAVPVQALDENADGTYTVTVLGADDKTKTLDVELGLIGDSYAEVASGLSSGDEVVIGTAAAGSTAVTTGFPGGGNGASD